MQLAPRALMIFGAGFGTRMGDLTNSRPKPLLEVGGTALLDHTLRIGREAAAAPIVVNTHHLHAQVADHLAGTDIVISHEHPDILDTGGGLRHAAPLLRNDAPFTLNPDCIWSGPNPLKTLASAWRPGQMSALLLVVPTSRALAFERGGDFDLDASGKLSRGGDYVYTGAQIIKTSGLEEIHEQSFSLNAYWNALEKQNMLFGVVYPGAWCDVGHPKGLAVAEELLKHGADV